MCTILTIKYNNCLSKHRTIERIICNPRCSRLETVRRTQSVNDLCRICYPTPITSDED